MPKKFFNRLERIDQLIRLKATGAPSQLAEKLEISESTLYEFIGVMKDLGAPIQWDNCINSYTYEPQGRMEIKFSREKRLTPMISE